MMTRAQTLSMACVLLASLAVGASWQFRNHDPRGRVHVAKILRARESRAFKERLRKGVKEDWAWPGLRAAQTSWIWLELLQGVHIPESYEGDFSWMFSKLYTVAQYSDPKEIRFLATLAPYYFVMGSDHAGATLFLDELTKRAPSSFNTWFWGGFHANDNLFNRQMASYFYGEAALKPGAPDYVATLSQRLKYGGDAFSDEAERKAILSGNIDPDLLEKIERVRPEWFKK